MLSGSLPVFMAVLIGLVPSLSFVGGGVGRASAHG